MTEFSGPVWCARFPGSHSLEDLDPDWRSHAWAFVSALERAGAEVKISATLRPKERAYLMHWCWMIAHLAQAPSAVPPMAGVAIDWTHRGDGKAAKAAALAMVKTYGLDYAPSLTSKHVAGLAVDMTITWNGRLSIRDFDGTVHYVLTEPRNGSNPELIKVGASYGVIKLVGDPPHWSDDGH